MLRLTFDTRQKEGVRTHEVAQVNLSEGMVPAQNKNHKTSRSTIRQFMRSPTPNQGFWRTFLSRKHHHHVPSWSRSSNVENTSLVIQFENATMNKNHKHTHGHIAEHIPTNLSKNIRHPNVNTPNGETVVSKGLLASSGPIARHRYRVEPTARKHKTNTTQNGTAVSCCDTACVRIDGPIDTPTQLLANILAPSSERSTQRMNVISNGRIWRAAIRQIASNGTLRLRS